VADPDYPAARQAEREVEHFKIVAAMATDDPVFKLISSLPTPMFLGLDRRTTFDLDDARLRPYTPARLARPGRNVFGGSLNRSVFDASIMAENNYRDALISSGLLSERVQREMVLGLLTFAKEDFGPLAVPTASEINELTVWP
jgi:hypothetical protein